MKKFLLIIIIVGFSSFAKAQELRVNTYAGYAFKDRVSSYYSSSSYFDGTIQDGFIWGAGLEYHIPNRGAIEIQYLRQDTNVPTTYQDSKIANGKVEFADFGLSINWIFVNGTRYFSLSEIVEPFAGAGVGMGIFGLENPKNNHEGSATKFFSGKASRISKVLDAFPFLCLSKI